jgi:hypothetical protein
MSERTINSGSTTIVDDRTPEQLQTHSILIVGTDKFLSNWGGAERGASYAAWATTHDHYDTVKSWVESRSDMIHVRTVVDPDYTGHRYRPNAACAHLHIYVVTPKHPSLDRS